MADKTCGQVAFEAWIERVRARANNSMLLFPHNWNDLSKEAQQDWEETVLEVLEYFDFHS